MISVPFCMIILTFKKIFSFISTGDDMISWEEFQSVPEINFNWMSSELSKAVLEVQSQRTWNYSSPMVSANLLTVWYQKSVFQSMNILYLKKMQRKKHTCISQTVAGCVCWLASKAHGLNLQLAIRFHCWQYAGVQINLKWSSHHVGSHVFALYLSRSVISAYANRITTEALKGHSSCRLSEF